MKKTKKKLLDTNIIKDRLDALTKEFVLMSHKAKSMADEGATNEEIDEIYIEIAYLYKDIRDLVDKELREQNPDLISFFECLVQLQGELN
jgi:hypothetical protein